MIELTHQEVTGWEAAIRGMRNPLNSWDNSDTFYFSERGSVPTIGENDLALMTNLSRAGDTHSKFLRMITVTIDIKAPLYWWKEFDTYKVGTIANSQSTMHTIHKEEFTMDMFAHDQLTGTAAQALKNTITFLNYYRNRYLDSNDKRDWYNMIQLLPSSFLQGRTVQMNYQVLKHIFKDRTNHKLVEWQAFCEWIKTLPYASELIVGEDDDKT